MERSTMATREISNARTSARTSVLDCTVDTSRALGMVSATRSHIAPSTRHLTPAIRCATGSVGSRNDDATKPLYPGVRRSSRRTATLFNPPTRAGAIRSPGRASAGTSAWAISWSIRSTGPHRYAVRIPPEALVEGDQHDECRQRPPGTARGLHDQPGHENHQSRPRGRPHET